MGCKTPLQSRARFGPGLSWRQVQRGMMAIRVWWESMSHALVHPPRRIGGRRWGEGCR